MGAEAHTKSRRSSRWAGYSDRELNLLAENKALKGQLADALHDSAQFEACVRALKQRIEELEGKLSERPGENPRRTRSTGLLFQGTFYSLSDDE